MLFPCLEEMSAQPLCALVGAISDDDAEEVRGIVEERRDPASLINRYLRCANDFAGNAVERRAVLHDGMLSCAVLHWAAMKASEQVMWELLQCEGVEVDIRGAHNRTPLCAAVASDLFFLGPRAAQETAQIYAAKRCYSCDSSLPPLRLRLSAPDLKVALPVEDDTAGESLQLPPVPLGGRRSSALVAALAGVRGQVVRFEPIDTRARARRSSEGDLTRLQNKRTVAALCAGQNGAMITPRGRRIAIHEQREQERALRVASLLLRHGADPNPTGCDMGPLELAGIRHGEVFADRLRALFGFGEASGE